MHPYTHLTTNEREMIFLMYEQGETLTAIGKAIGRSKSTISRELRRNSDKNNHYSPSQAHKKYKKRKQLCGRHRKLQTNQIFLMVKRLFLEEQWSPEQISGRLSYEGAYNISYNTIYRAIYRGEFDQPNLPKGNLGVKRYLRHHGKPRHPKNHVETRGKISISHTIHERPLEANERSAIGHWEADTVAGKTGKACLVTLVDRKSRFLLVGKSEKKASQPVIDQMIKLLRGIEDDQCKTITPDRGKEFSQHARLTETLNDTQVYFPDPHAPWQRGTNENTNGLLREYTPKGVDLSDATNEDIQTWAKKLNTRPKKCLNWKTPYEIFYDTVLHLI